MNMCVCSAVLACVGNYLARYMQVQVRTVAKTKAEDAEQSQVHK